MKDTTFWPNGRATQAAGQVVQAQRDKGPGRDPIGQLKYPLDDPQRQPMPAGGLFSTAADLCRFYRMLASGGVLDGKRILSERPSSR